MTERSEGVAVALDPVVGRAAVICMNTWAGRIEAPCRVIGETPMRWRVAVDNETRLPGRVLKPGTLALIPKWSVRFMPPNPCSRPAPSLPMRDT